MHIPKTGGSYIRSVLLDPLCEDFNFYKKTTGWHYYWEPVEEDTYVICSFREPVKRLISEFVFTNANHFPSKNKIEKNTRNLLNWVEENKGVCSNYQAKSFFYEQKEPLVFQNTFNLILENMVIDEEMLYQRLNRVNILLKTNQLNVENLKMVRKDILNFFKLEDVLTPSAPQKTYNATLSRVLYEKLSPSEIQYLESLNKIDLDIYYNDSLFWNEGK